MSDKKTMTFAESVKHFQGVVNRIGIKRAVFLFFQELSALISAGIPIVESIESIYESTSSKKLKKELAFIAESIKEGATLSQALDARGLLPPRILILLQVGEKSGNLANALKTIVLQNEKELRFSDAVRSSLLYV